MWGAIKKAARFLAKRSTHAAAGAILVTTGNVIGSPALVTIGTALLGWAAPHPADRNPKNSVPFDHFPGKGR